MKKLFLITTLMCGLSSIAQAQVSYLDEVKALGLVSGQAMACGAPKHPTFEMLARAIILTKAPSQKLLTQAAYTYNEAKANTYMAKQLDGNDRCQEIVNRFNQQDIFKIVLYADGTLKMPDGKMITPKQAYNAATLYQADPQNAIRAQKIYNSAPSRLPEGSPQPKFQADRSASVQKPQTGSLQRGHHSQPRIYQGSQPEPHTSSNIKHLSRHY